MKEKIKEIVEETDTRGGRFFAMSIQILIFISLISFSVETLPDLSSNVRTLLRIIEIVIVVIFTIEYVARIFVADNKLKFIFSFFGLVDLVAVLPFYIATGLDLRTIRLFRILRLVRILKLVRYNRAINHFKQALSIAREELIIFGLITLIILYLSSVGIYYFEHEAQPEQFKSVIHSLWWSVATLTTVGYGDVFPITAGGRTFTFFVLMSGLGIVAVPTGILASALSKVTDKESETEE